MGGHGHDAESRRPPGRKPSYLLWLTATLAPLLAFVLACPNVVWSETVKDPTLGNVRRVAETPTGDLLVTDRSGLIVKVDKDSLEPVSGFRLPLDGAPFGLATLDHLVFVGNTETKNVEVYELPRSRGKKLELSFAYNLGGVPAGEMGTIEKPIGIGVGRSAELVFVLDGKAKTVKVFRSDGLFLREFAPAGLYGMVLSPVSLAVDETHEEVLVGDYGDPGGTSHSAEPARILAFDFDGNLRYQIDGSGFWDSGLVFRRVQGMAASVDGRIFAADPLGGRILVFQRGSGTLLDVLGTRGDEPGQLRIPTDLLLDPESGDLFIVNNRGARRVEAFRGAGGQP